MASVVVENKIVRHTPALFAPNFLWGGFECTFAKPTDASRERLDVLAATGHDRLCRKDYRLLKDRGIYVVREGLSPSAIDKGHGRYDFGRFEQMMWIAQEEGIRQIWDLNHFDYQEGVNILSDDFPKVYADYCAACMRTIGKYQEGDFYVVPWNEISFFAWIAGEAGAWMPGLKNEGFRLKYAIVRACIQAMKAMRQESDRVRFIHTDPLMYRIARYPSDREAVEWAEQFKEIRFQAWDMISGRLCPELGGHPSFLDVIGVNSYYRNQEWVIPDRERSGHYRPWGIAWGSKSRVPLSMLLREVYERYGKSKPIVISETGHYIEIKNGRQLDQRCSFWNKVFEGVDEALEAGIPIEGVCMYPVIDYPDWGDGHIHRSGVFTTSRIPYKRLLSSICRQAEKLILP